MASVRLYRKNRESRETGNIEYTTRHGAKTIKTKNTTQKDYQQQNVGHHYILYVIQLSERVDNVTFPDKDLNFPRRSRMENIP